jgi:hypothetical protein
MEYFLKKILRKLFRTLKGLTIFSLIIFQRIITSNIFKINEISVQSSSSVFNIAAVIIGNKTILMGREFHNSPNLNEVKDIYFGIFDEKNNQVTFNEPVNLDLLKHKIPGFIRLEDPRPFFQEDEIYAICACVILENRSFENVWCVKQIIVKINEGKVSEYKLFETKQVFEKNWVIFVSQFRRVSLCYSVQPLIFIDVNLGLENSRIPFFPENSSTFNIRNSSHFVSVEGFKISVCHKYIDLGFRFLCVHFFVKIDNLGNIMKSGSFVFRRFSNEYATSLVHLKSNKFQIYFSDHERGNYIAEFSFADLFKLNWKSL